MLNDDYDYGSFIEEMDSAGERALLKEGRLSPSDIDAINIYGLDTGDLDDAEEDIEEL